MIAYVNDKFLDEEKATLQVSDLAIHRGYGIFDFFRISNNIPLFLDDYLDRFFNSAAAMRLEVNQSRGELKTIIYELIRRNNTPQSGIKIILTGGYSTDGHELASPNLVMLQQKLPLFSTDNFAEGIKVITHEYQRDLPRVKSINYLMGVWLQQKVKDKHADDVLYYKQEVISELPRSNVFMVTHDRKIVTPSDDILHGITRGKLLELAAIKYPVEVRTVYIEEIKNAAEVFVTSTIKRVLPITRIDDIIIGTGKAGPITEDLREAFAGLEEKALKCENVKM